MRKGLAPAGQGGKEFKDCLIIEHFLAAGAALRSAGIAETMLFVSSNKNDYGDPPGASPLNTEFAAMRLDYVTDLAWAVSLL